MTVYISRIEERTAYITPRADSHDGKNHPVHDGMLAWWARHVTAHSGTNAFIGHSLSIPWP